MILPIVVDVACKRPPFPDVEVIDFTPGNTLYPLPPSTKFNVFIGPDAPFDLIAISITVVSASVTDVSLTVNVFGDNTSFTICLPIIGAVSTLSSNIA